MRFLDVAVDLAALLSASRSVASKHVALRGAQLDRYNRTSSVAAALRRQNRDHQKAPGQASQPPRGSEQEEAASRAAQDADAAPIVSGTGLDGALDGKVGGSSSPDVDVEDVELPSFVTRSKAVPAPVSIPGVSRESHALPTASRLHPLDPRNGAASLRQDAGRSSDTKGPGIADGVNLDVFRNGREEVGNKVVEKADGPAMESNKAGEPSQASPDLAMSTAEPTTLPSPETPKVTQSLASQASSSSSSSSPQSSKLQPDAATTTPVPQTKPDRVTAQEAADLGELMGGASSSTPHQLRESKVPSSRLGRLWNYGGLAAGMLGGALTESISRGFGGNGQGSVMLSAGNMERLVAKLSRMRGAALKLGQLMSFQDSKMLPAPIQEVLQRVQDRADYMPAWQRDRVLAQNLGPNWRELFETIEDKPIAAASIGQVHRATLKSNGAAVAVKIQFPGVADSINSDLDNLSILLTATKLLPKGLYLNKTIDNARTELGWECDYIREAESAQRYRELLGDEDDTFIVPKIYSEASGKQVLTMEFMEGIGVTRVTSFTQEQRDWIGTQILRLCLRELTEFRFMQTDPNWTNFLYNAHKQKLELLDFGASREYPDAFVTRYVQLLYAASKANRDGVRDLSVELGYLTGHESKTMLDAHIQSVLTLAEPFLDSAPEVYDFRDQTITERVKALIPVMIHERLAPPPEETYSLHRKLSGAFLLCAKLGSQVRCRDLFRDSIEKSGLV